jgi:dephospho-CoA kinase
VARVVVLLGPPGSGKSTVGAALGELGFRWREWEPVILERWGSREHFVEEKASALPWLHSEIRDWIDLDHSIAVIETTGLSDAPLLDTLERESMAFVVRLDVSEDEAMRRIAQRPSHRHLSDELEINRRVWRAFYAVVAPTRDVDAVVGTEVNSPTEIAALIAERTRPP